MMRVGEAQEFLDGKHGDALELTYAKTDDVIKIERLADGTAHAFIPKKPADSSDTFSIEAALRNPQCAAKFRVDALSYIVEISNRSQLYSVIKIAMNHLHWFDDKLMNKRYIASVG